MLFRRRSRKDRMVATAKRLAPAALVPVRLLSSRRAATAAAGAVGVFVALTAASSGVSAVRQKQA